MTVIASWGVDAGPGRPYAPKVLGHYLIRAGEPQHGKRFYLRVDGGCSRTWLTDAEARQILKKATASKEGA